LSDFARILALFRARVITVPTIHMGVIECKLPMRIVGIVITRHRHTAKIRAEKRYSTAYLALKGCVKLNTVCAQTVPSVSVPVIYFPKGTGFHSELAYCGKSTRINNRKITPTGGGIQVGVANNQSMQQIEEGVLPFDRLPTAANDVQVFPSMQSPLIGCGKLAANGCGIWFDN
jgi:hypothetical protein